LSHLYTVANTRLSVCLQNYATGYHLSATLDFGGWTAAKGKVLDPQDSKRILVVCGLLGKMSDTKKTKWTERKTDTEADFFRVRLNQAMNT
jgi:hypothetical protein